MVNNISGVILAGGASKRFNGINKTRILIDGKTIISRMIDTIVAEVIESFSYRLEE